MSQDRGQYKPYVRQSNKVFHKRLLFLKMKCTGELSVPNHYSSGLQRRLTRTGISGRSRTMGPEALSWIQAHRENALWPLDLIKPDRDPVQGFQPECS